MYVSIVTTGKLVNKKKKSTKSTKSSDHFDRKMPAKRHAKIGVTKWSEHLERKMPAKGASPLGYHRIQLFEREKGMKKVEAQSKLCCCIY